jgi:1,4-dihydroxy-6-naphthoate synthase
MTSASAPAEPQRLSPARLSIAYSPCPNDTFIFHAWAHGLVPDAPPIDVTYADIDVTNNLVGDGGLDVMLTAPGGPTDLAGRTVAVPSLKSTAFLLFQRWAEGLSQHSAEGGGAARIRVLPFRDIMPAVRDGEVDAGLVIHEARFTYAGYGLQCLVDLGEWWESTTGAPIPLGAIVARRSLGPQLIARITAAIRASVDQAFADPEASREYVLEHAEEMDPEVAKAHIALYVNEFSRDLGPVGYAAVERLLAISLERPSIAEG